MNNYDNQPQQDTTTNYRCDSGSVVYNHKFSLKIDKKG
jgi:hypothetical protein